MLCRNLSKMAKVSAMPYRATCYTDVSYVAKMHCEGQITKGETFVF